MHPQGILFDENELEFHDADQTRQREVNVKAGTLSFWEDQASKKRESIYPQNINPFLYSRPRIAIAEVEALAILFNGRAQLSNLYNYKK
jgi:hypothetical protein